MNYFHLLNWYSSFGLMLFSVVSLIQPTPTRKIAVLCLYLSLISPLMAYAFYTARQELPGYSLQYDITLAVFGPLASLLIYCYGCWMLCRVEDRAAKRRAILERPTADRK